MLMTSLFGTNIPGYCCVLQARSGSCHITPPLLTGFGFILGEKMTQVAQYVKWAVKHLGMPFFSSSSPRFSWTADASSSSVGRRSAVCSSLTTSCFCTFCFWGPCFPRPSVIFPRKDPRRSRKCSLPPWSSRS